MVTDDKSDYDGWTIEAHCRENKPKDWKPGDAIPYIARLSAQLRRPEQFPPGWTGVKYFSIPENGFQPFDDWTEAYRALKREAHDRIDGMKKV